MQRLQVAAKFYDLLVLMFDIPRKEPTMAHGDVTVFCPRGKKWRYSAYEDEQMRAEYQKNAEWMALVKNGAWLIWRGDDFDTDVDSRIRPLIREYARLRMSMTTKNKDEPVHSEPARIALNKPSNAREGRSLHSMLQSVNSEVSLDRCMLTAL
jgi:hypothetical protein